MAEIQRQLIHLSGLIFVFIAQFLTGILSAVLFIIIAGFFFFYWEYIKRKAKPLFGFRNLALRFERKDVARPFLGAFWFYIGGGIAFLLFSHSAASASISILAVGDSLATIIGTYIGRNRIVGKKTLEGSIAFFVGAFFISIAFVPAIPGLVAAAAATIIELGVSIGLLEHVRKKGYLDDNLLIPIIGGALLMLI